MKFSESFSRIGLSPIVEISEKAASFAPGYEKETGLPFVYFQRGEVGFNTPDYVKQALSDAVSVKNLTKYPKSGGEHWFKDAVLSHLVNDMGVLDDLKRENVICTYGGQEGLQLSFCLFSGGRAAGFGPIWSCMLENILPYSNFNMSLVPFIEEEGKLLVDYNRLEDALKGVDIFYLNNPHNPTGKVFSLEELTVIDQLCKDNDVLIVSDEAYKDIVFDGREHTSMLEFGGDHIVSVFSFSKSFAVTGLRVGYTVTRNRDIIRYMTRGNYTQTAGVLPSVQHAMRVALENNVERGKWISSFVGELEQRRNLVFDSLKELDRGIYKPEGAFYFFLNLNKYLPGCEQARKDSYLLEEFFKNGIAVVPGSAFGKGFEGYARLSFSTVDQAKLLGGVERMKGFLPRLRS